MFKIMYIDQKVINKIISMLEDNTLPVDSDTCTVNGFKSKNIINIFSKNLLKKILPFKDFYKKIFHIHYIKYYLNGYQERHNHIKTEKYSFILYLNDAKGDTIFEEPIKKRISCEMGKLLFFSANIWHKAEMSPDEKKVLVGAVDRNVV